MNDSHIFESELLHVRLGIEIITATLEKGEASMPVAGNLQPAGLLNGGASAALIETIASACAQNAAPGRPAVGTDLSVTHLRPVRAGTVRALARCVHCGKTTVVHEVEVVNEKGQRTAVGRLTSRILD